MQSQKWMNSNLTLIINVNNSNVGVMLDQRQHINPYSAGINFRRKILTSKVDPLTEGVKLFIMAVLNLQHRYSNEAEIAD